MSLMKDRTAIIAVLTVAVLGSLYFFRSSSPTFRMASTSASSADVSSLVLTLAQTSTSPPTLKVTLKNTHTSSTFTVLEWDTPLDKQAFNVGVFQAADATGAKIGIPRLMINRKLPPPREALVELVPGAEASKELPLDKRWMPRDKFTIKAEGKWKALWEKAAGDVQASDLEELGGSTAKTGEFRSDEVTVDLA
ncbi:uncharacterized protein BDZ99DRAFT_457510 [Mytilinidion resinicola]|uniref:Uncharacterized protein n=1 Tax=Mytilinidion resinicola TaxID=574789 RepID=A0A6A6ZC73_9PEZI|nr:uncharacterized protein BDZ99DRAFT_457510 [Mytilinidion resinicola]KAF2817827.1 hypothetical protein BDZ99DRAFT_457510 [Mytilinidion resinicola]